MRQLLFIWLLVLGCTTSKVQAQLPLDMEQYAKDLYNSLDTAPNDSVRATIYYNLVTYWTYKDSIKTFDYLAKGHALSKNNLYLEGMYHAKKGYYYYATEDLEESKREYLKADEILSQITGNKESYKTQSDIWNNISVIYQIEDNDEKFVELVLTKAIPFAEKANDTTRLATYYISLGIGFMNLEQYDKAIPYFLKAENLLLSQKDQTHRLISMYNRTAECYLILNQLDKAKHYLDQTAKIIQENPNSDQKSIYYLVKGFFLKKNKELNASLNAYNEALTYTAGPNKTYHIHEINIYKVDVLLEMKRYNEALQLSLALEKDPFTLEIDSNKATVYKYIASAYKGLGKLDLAYVYIEKYSDLNAEIHKQDFKRKINTLELKYDVTRKEKELLQLKISEEEAQFKLKNSQLITALALAGLVILLLITLITLGSYRNNKRRLLQHEIIHQQKIREQHTEAQLAVKNAVLESEEQERQRIAQDLHDSMGGMLANIRLSVSTLESDKKVELTQKIDQSINEMRRISRNLMPETLKNLGLEVAIRELCESMAHKNLSIQYEAYNLSDQTPFQIQLALYRIVQEAISNCLKYAQATTVIVQISQSENMINLTIEDDGIGFNPREVVYGLGLKNIQNRVHLIHGKFELISAVGEGTTLNIECYG